MPVTQRIDPGKAAAQKAARDAKIASLAPGLAEINAKEAPSEATPSAPVDEKPADKTAETLAPAVEAKPEPDKPAEKPAETVEPDAATQKQLALIDKRAKAWRDEQAQAKAELAAERAELARQKAELAKGPSSVEALKELFRKDRVAALQALGADSEDEFETIARAAYAHTAAGKKDPKAAASAQQSARERELLTRIDAMEKRFEEMGETITKREQAAAARDFISQWQDKAIKAIPATPTLIAKLHEKAPDKARAALSALGAEMETERMREAGAPESERSEYTPTHADVIAEYEKRRRAELEEMGVDVDAMLKSASKAPVSPPPKTLDVAAPTNGTAIKPTMTRAEKIAALDKNVRTLGVA